MTARSVDRLADHELIKRLADGELDAFTVIFGRHASAAFSLAYRICRTQADAEQVVQEVFASVWRNSGQYDHARGSVRAWLLQSVHNRAIDHIRQTRPDSGDAGDEPIVERIAAGELIDTKPLQREVARQVQQALRALPADQREVIELAYFDGLTHTQIAQLVHLPPGTVKGRMHLGLTKLRAVLRASASTSAPTSASIGAAQPVHNARREQLRRLASR